MRQWQKTLDLGAWNRQPSSFVSPTMSYVMENTYVKRDDDVRHPENVNRSKTTYSLAARRTCQAKSATTISARIRSNSQQTEPANTNPTSNPLAAWRLMGMGSVYE